jgi:sec-independent protein translocase protein TatA
MFGLGPFELILILLAILILFGAGRLPQVLGSLGKGVKEFREASEGTTTTTTGTTATSDSTNPPDNAAATTMTTQPPAAQNTTTPPPETKA